MEYKEFPFGFWFDVSITGWECNGIFDSMKINLFSDMQGIVTMNGDPVSGAVVKRSATPASNKKFTDSFVTKVDGRFQFDRMVTNSFLKILPGDPSVYQKVTIEYNGRSYLAWEILAASDRYKGELNDRDVIGTEKQVDINLLCELTAKSTQKEAAGSSVVSGICTWANASN